MTIVHCTIAMVLRSRRRCHGGHEAEIRATTLLSGGVGGAAAEVRWQGGRKVRLESESRRLNHSSQLRSTKSVKLTCSPAANNARSGVTAAEHARSSR